MFDIFGHANPNQSKSAGDYAMDAVGIGGDAAGVAGAVATMAGDSNAAGNAALGLSGPRAGADTAGKVAGGVGGVMDMISGISEFMDTDDNGRRQLGLLLRRGRDRVVAAVRRGPRLPRHS
jgi:hypothetical protein